MMHLQLKQNGVVEGLRCSPPLRYSESISGHNQSEWSSENMGHMPFVKRACRCSREFSWKTPGVCLHFHLIFSDTIGHFH